MVKFQLGGVGVLLVLLSCGCTRAPLGAGIRVAEAPSGQKYSFLVSEGGAASVAQKVLRAMNNGDELYSVVRVLGELRTAKALPFLKSVADGTFPNTRRKQELGSAISIQTSCEPNGKRLATSQSFFSPRLFYGGLMRTGSSFIN